MSKFTQRTFFLIIYSKLKDLIMNKNLAIKIKCNIIGNFATLDISQLKSSKI